MKIANSMNEKIKAEVLLILIFIVSTAVCWIGFNFFEISWNYSNSFECFLVDQVVYAVMLSVLFNIIENKTEYHYWKKRLYALFVEI